MKNIIYTCLIIIASFAVAKTGNARPTCKTISLPDVVAEMTGLRLEVIDDDGKSNNGNGNNGNPNGNNGNGNNGNGNGNNGNGNGNNGNNGNGNGNNGNGNGNNGNGNGNNGNGNGNNGNKDHWKVPPGQTKKIDKADDEEWTPEQYLEWEQAIREANDTVPLPPKPEIIPPDFENMTDEDITAWEDSVREVLFPPIEILTYDTINGEIQETRSLNASTAVSETGDMQLRGNYVNNYVPTSYNIDKGISVGEIPISSQIMPNGALTYNVPIEVYPGINGCQPNISMSYNSFGANGIAGKGWSIGGLSSITRSSKNLYYDNRAEGVTGVSNDPFLLDGMRLIKLTESSGQIEYESEQGYIRVIAYLSGSIVRYFTVRYPNGNTATYGYSGNYSNQPSYPLTELKDRFGNTITYQYDYRDNNYTPTKISYGNASIEFQYDNSRFDAPFHYQAGMKVKINRRLYDIKCKYGSTVLRTYTFNYSMGDYNRLDKIALTASGLSVNPLKFYYGGSNSITDNTTSQTQLIEWYNFTVPSDVKSTRGKFDYGTDDDGAIVWPFKIPYDNETRGSTMFQHSRNRFNNQYSGTEKIFLYTGLNSTYAYPMPYLTTETGFIDIFCANIDGLYEDEVIKVNNTRINNTYNEQIQFKIYKGSLYYGLGLWATRTFTFPTAIKDADDGYSVHPKYYFTGDFNGNGKTEVLALACQNPGGYTISSKCYLFDLDANTKLFEGAGIIPFEVNFYGTNQKDLTDASEKTDKLLILDYDGDGKSDICHINNQGTHIYTFDVNGSNYSLRKVATYTGITKEGLKKRQLLPGEYNGDGKMDLLVSPVGTANASDYTWAYHYSNGNGQFDKLNTYGSDYKETEPFIAQDINGDGITDLLRIGNAGYYTYPIKPYGSSVYSSYYTSFSATSSIIIPVDINNGNYFGRIVSIKGGTATKYYFQEDETRKSMLTGVVNSRGVIDRNHFRKLDESGSFYTKGSGATFPYINMSAPVYVPVNREKYYNGQLHEDMDFRYENAVLHLQGLGFRGFGKLTAYDQIRGRESYQKFDPYRFGVCTEEESPSAKITNDYTVSVQSNKTVKTTLNSRTSVDKLKGTTQTATYSNFDTYGNPKQETISFGDGITQTTSCEYVNQTGTPYILGFLRDKTVTVTRNGQSNSRREYVQSYNSLLMPELVYTYANGNKTAEKGYAYNSQGRITQESDKPYTSAIALATSYLYDGYGRITRKTDPLGLYTTYEYHPSTGYLSVQKNHKSQSTSYGYDGLGRATSVSYPDGVVKSSSFNWSSGAGLYTVTSSQTGKPTATIYYDAFGREVMSDVVRYNNAVQKAETQYDSYGRLYKVSLPYTGSAASYWNTYTYDSYDRPLYITQASGNRTSYSYSGKNVTVTKDGISSTQTYDAQGNLISVADPAGTITYNLRADGQPSSIVALGNVTTDFGYDAYGRQTSINDPSAGNRTYQYNDAGLLWYETDANGRRKEIKYDAYNRLQQKILPEFSTTYVYNPDGLLESETSTNGTSTTYMYDAYMRPDYVQENGTNSKWFRKKYDYSNGNTSSVTYSSQSGTLGVESYNYTNGHLTDISFGGTSIWKLTSENQLGQPTSLTTGPLTRTYNFDAYGLPTGRYASSNNSGTFQNFSTNFDAQKGNLSNRKDNSYNIQEDFTYDGLNRLKTYAGKNMEYDLNGNIKQKNDVSTNFIYNTSGKPYAISHVEPTTPNASIPMRTQSVSYTSFERPSSISENNYTATFTYNAASERVKMQLLNGSSNYLTRYYLGGSQYEIDEGTLGSKEKLYLGGNAYTAPAVYLKQNGSWSIHYICRDYLGSITHITNANGSLVEELSYDAWGRRRNPYSQAIYAPDAEPTTLLGRGYTGHEQLPWFGLINMNARLYDPAIGRFLSPDPFVQDPGFSQDFNRYSYGLNNPLRYTDMSGELKLGWWAAIADVLTGGAVTAVATLAVAMATAAATTTVSTLYAFSTTASTSFSSSMISTDIGYSFLLSFDDPAAAGKRMDNTLKIMGGMWQTNPKKDFWGRALQLISRHTWELPQTHVGIGFTSFRNLAGDVDRVDYFDGATFATNENASDIWGVTLGNYININIKDKITGSFQDRVLSDPLFMHEYGHTIDSWAFGPSYLFTIGIPSLISADGNEYDSTVGLYTHDYFWTERRANKRAAKYFGEYYGINWSGPTFYYYPLYNPY